MSNEAKVNPTPIQRNLNDVAMELTQLYYRAQNTGKEYTIERIHEVYKHFYAIAVKSECMTIDEINELLEEK